MKEYVENMKEYAENTKKYVENTKEYEEIGRYIGFCSPISLWGLGKIPRPSFLLGSGTWKNSALYRLWDLNKF